MDNLTKLIVEELKSTLYLKFTDFFLMKNKKAILIKKHNTKKLPQAKIRLSCLQAAIFLGRIL